MEVSSIFNKKVSKNFIFFFGILFLSLIFIYSFKSLSKERIYLKINDSNREYIYTQLEGYVPNVNFIYKVAAGTGFHSGIIYVFSYSNTIQEFSVDSSLDDLDIYIRDNGYSLDTINLNLMFLSFTLLIVLVILKIKKKL